MKLSSYTVPSVVALAGLCWIGVRQREIHGLRLEAATTGRSVASVSGAADGPGRRMVESDRARLRRWAKAFRSGGYGWLRTDLREREELESVSREGLIAALDHLAEAGLDENERANMAARLLNLLEKIDPEYATRRYGRDSALALWAKDDPAGAVAWFEAQVATGKFKSKGASGGLHDQIAMQRGLVRALITSDPTAAGRLLEALPENQRINVFRMNRWSIGAEDLPELAQVLRAHLPEEDRVNVLNWALCDKSSLGETGMVDWDGVERYFQRIDATPDERRAGVLAVAQAGRFPRASGSIFDTHPDDIDALRTWVAKEDAALTTEATAGAMKRVANQFHHDYPLWAGYALQLHEAGEGDEVLRVLLEAHQAPEHPELARSLAGRLAAGEERERFLKKFDKPGP